MTIDDLIISVYHFFSSTSLDPAVERPCTRGQAESSRSYQFAVWILIILSMLLIVLCTLRRSMSCAVLWRPWREYTSSSLVTATKHQPTTHNVSCEVFAELIVIVYESNLINA